MFTSKFLSRLGIVAIIIMLALGSFQPALAVGANDFFVNATVIESLPFSTSADMYGATYEAGEPLPSCGYGYSPNSVWFAYTPLNNITLSVPPTEYSSSLAIYTGSGIGDLTQIFCSSNTYYPQAFQAQANMTYYFQLSYLYPWWSGNIYFSLEVTPPPSVNFTYYPSDPSIFDDVYFQDMVYDPGLIWGGTWVWNLGDGTTVYDFTSFSHQYTADGDYTVSLTYTTSDGRSASGSNTVQVRTRDVAITKFSVPQTAKSNTTKEIAVEVTNRRYSDNVQVQLYKGLPGGGEQLIGTLTIFVPARANRATLFKFSYTYTGCDATIGKVTFRTTATIMGGHDALPADNALIRTTQVTGTNSSCDPTANP